MKKAVVLLSGGLDSSTVLGIAKSEGFECFALSFDYDQRHAIELAAAKLVADSLKATAHKVIKLDLRAFGGSALTDDIDVPKTRTLEEMSKEIPVTYVPARNTIFLSYALAWAEVLNTGHIFIGVNSLDYSGYPDCRPEFIDAYQNMANLAVKEAVEGSIKISIHTPLIELTKAEIINRGLKLGIDYSLTSSCYDPGNSGQPCGECDSCLLRQKGFEEIGCMDPLLERFEAA
jgi:7-cyano-7-deazaguanine synthase